MEYRKLNLIDGPDQDMQDFMRLLNAALEAGHTQVNMGVLAPMVARGNTEAVVAQTPEGVAVGLQVWDIGQPWNFDANFCVMRVCYLEATHSTLANLALFFQAGTAQQKLAHPDAQFAAAQTKLPGHEYLSACGLSALATLYAIP